MLYIPIPKPNPQSKHSALIFIFYFYLFQSTSFCWFMSHFAHKILSHNIHWYCYTCGCRHKKYKTKLWSNKQSKAEQMSFFKKLLQFGYLKNLINKLINISHRHLHNINYCSFVPLNWCHITISNVHS